MKILPIIDTARVGGPGKGLISLVNQLNNRCDIKSVVSFRKGNNPSNFIDALEENSISAIVIHESKLFDISAIKELYNVIQDESPDIVQTHGYKSSFYMFILRYFMGVRDNIWIAWIHGWTAENIKIKIFHFIEKVCVLGANKIIFVSDSLIRRTYSPKRKSVIVYNGIDEQYNDVNIGDIKRVKNTFKAFDNKLKILVVGRLSNEKGQDYIPKLANILRQKLSDFVFLVVGEGPDKENLVREIEQLGVSDHVVLLPYDDEIRPYFILSDIYLLPSRYEGMPNVVLESMYLRCPVISFDVGGVTEIISNSNEGIVVEQGNVNDLAKSIIYLVNDPEYKELIIQSGFNRIKDVFLSNKRADRVYSLYKEQYDQHSTNSLKSS